MSKSTTTPFEQAVTHLASRQPELNPQPFKPSYATLHYQLQGAWAQLERERAQVAELAEALRDLYGAVGRLTKTTGYTKWLDESCTFTAGDWLSSGTINETLKAGALLARLDGGKA